MPDAPFEIRAVRFAADLEATMRLFDDYASSLGIDLSFQGFAVEFATLPGKYAPPRGELLLARDGSGEPLGCVGLRPSPTDGDCEMKRLYVTPRARGLGVGGALIEAIVEQAARIGYRRMLLDTLPSMTRAVALYRTTGFAPIGPYYETPLAGTLFFARSLASGSLSESPAEA